MVFADKRLATCTLGLLEGGNRNVSIGDVICTLLHSQASGCDGALGEAGGGCVGLRKDPPRGGLVLRRAPMGRALSMGAVQVRPKVECEHCTEMYSPAHARATDPQR